MAKRAADLDIANAKTAKSPRTAARCWFVTVVVKSGADADAVTATPHVPVLDASQQHALDMIGACTPGSRLMIQGHAKTGKNTLVQALIAQGYRVHIVTLSKWTGTRHTDDVATRVDKARVAVGAIRLPTTHCIIVMGCFRFTRVDFDVMHTALKKTCMSSEWFGGKAVVMIGDEWQGVHEENPIHTAAWPGTPTKSIRLDTNHVHAPDYLEILNRIGSNTIDHATLHCYGWTCTKLPPTAWMQYTNARRVAMERSLAMRGTHPVVVTPNKKVESATRWFSLGSRVCVGGSPGTLARFMKQPAHTATVSGTHVSIVADTGVVVVRLDTRRVVESKIGALSVEAVWAMYGCHARRPPADAQVALDFSGCRDIAIIYTVLSRLSGMG